MVVAIVDGWPCGFLPALETSAASPPVSFSPYGSHTDTSNEQFWITVSYIRTGSCCGIEILIIKKVPDRSILLIQVYKFGSTSTPFACQCFRDHPYYSCGPKANFSSFDAFRRSQLFGCAVQMCLFCRYLARFYQATSGSGNE